MLSYLTIGANDVALSTRFYDAVLLPMGYERRSGEDYAHYSLPDVADRDNGPGTVFVMKPFDGGIATAGNGMMPAFRLRSPDDVKALHEAGIGAGGVDEGAPGTRECYAESFFVAYLRDPVGNKIALFTVLDAALAVPPKSFVRMLMDFPGGIEFERDRTPIRDIDL